jgi:O-glycosyl hydrolase
MPSPVRSCGASAAVRRPASAWWSSLVVALVVALAAAAPAPAADVTLDANARHQQIEGWGTFMQGSNPQTLAAYRDLGLNIMRMSMPKEVLVDPSGDHRVRVPLGTNLNDNVAKMRFNTSATSGFGSTAQWLKQNTLEPDRFKLIADAWSPPHWMKGPTGDSSPWVGNPVNALVQDYTNNNLLTTITNSPSFPTPWLSNQYNGWKDYMNIPANPVNTPGNPHFIGYAGDSIGGRLRVEDATNLAEYGRYMAAWVTGFERQYGVEIDNISLQNESTFENPFDSMTFRKNAAGQDDFTQYATALKSVKDAFAAQGVDTKIRGPHMANLLATPDNPWGLWSQGQMILGVKNHADPTLIDALSAYTSNYYMGVDENAVRMTAAYWHGTDEVPLPAGQAWANWTGWRDGVANDGKSNWYVETGDGNGAWRNGANGTPGNGAITVALKMYNAIVHSDASAYLYWQFTDGDAQPSTYNLLGESQVSDPSQSKKYNAFKHFSRFVRPGATRITATFDGTGGRASTGGASEYDTLHSLNVTAFVHDADRTATIVLLNLKASDELVNIAVPLGLDIDSFERYLTSDTADFAQLADLPVAGDGRISLLVPRYSLVTLFGAAPVPEPAAVVGGAAVLLLLARRRWA